MPNEEQTKHRVRPIRRSVAIAIVGALLGTSAVVGLGVSAAPVAAADALPSPAPLLQRDDSVVTSDPLPTVQIDNGYVWSQATIGSTVYAVGQFANARAALAAPGTQLTPRSNILAFDINTGALLPFAPTVNGTIKAVAASPDGSRIYIGGSFNNVNGQSRWNFAALDAVTGQLIPGLNPSIGGTGVYALVATAGTVYLGGLFSQANGTARTNAAAFSTTNGALLPWAPIADLQIDAMVMDPAGQKVILGGRFGSVNGDFSMRGVAAVDRTTGVVDTNWALPQTVKNGLSTGTTAGRAGIFGLATDQNGVYGTGWVFANAATGNLEGVFAAEADTGEVRWIADCLGDHYGVYSTGSVVYSTSHTHACMTLGLHPEQSPRTHRFVEAFTADARGTLLRQPATGTTYQNWEGTPSPAAYVWYPDFAVGVTSGLGQAGLSITGVGNVISVAGEFRSVNNRQYEGIVRFSTTPPGGAKDGPRLSSTTWSTPSARSLVPGRARVTIPANWDRDDKDLTYELLRTGTSTPVATKTVASTWWNLPSIMLEDLAATPGTAQTYRVRVSDGDGNTVTSQSVSVTIADGDPPLYVDAVWSDNPSLYYPLGEPNEDWAGSNAPIVGTGVSAGTPSGVVGSATGFSNFSGDTNGRVSTTSTVAATPAFSTELWFRTTTTRGGKLIGYGSARTGSSGSYDRHVYMLNDGRLTFGVYPGAVRAVSTTASYNDGQWHHMVATLSSDGMRLYVDGQLRASNASVTTAQQYTGYWRIGGDNLSGWPSRPSSDYFAGAIDEVAVYPYALNASHVATHYGVGSGVQPPTASFTTTVNELELSVDGTGSAATGGATIVGYSWNFGDGTPLRTGPTATHTYAAPGTYTVALTVTDSRGLTARREEVIVVTGPNAPPTASFVTSTNGLRVSADASDSVDVDGQIVSYEWNWGEGGATSTGQVASHSYGAAGTYTVTLKVTDDRGGVATTSQAVAVTHADPVARFQLSTSGRTVAVDAGASSASDGATLSYRWDWGDGSPASSGMTAGHTYAADGDYIVTLTVTDSLGAADSTTATASVTATVYAASDTFSRVVSSGWGAADVGGTWMPASGSASVASVANGKGVLLLAPGQTRRMMLQELSLLDTETTITYTMGGSPSNGASYVGLGARHTGVSSNYAVLAWHRADGTIWLVAQRNATAFATSSIGGVTWGADSTYYLKTEVFGTNPTTIRAKIWAVGTAEPSGWQIQTTDSTAALQSPGSAVAHYYLAGSASAAAAVYFDDLTVRDLSLPTANVPPVAEFTSGVSGLSVSVDGSSSTDPDGSIVSYSWNWGDGTALGSGVTASHSYAAAGAYTVTLTVVDNAGASHSVSKTITVQAPPAENVPPVAEFTSGVSGLSVSVDGSSSTDPDGSIVSYSWNWGDGTALGSGVTASHSYAAAGAYTVTLTVVDNAGASHSVSKTITVQAPPAENVPPVAEFTSGVSGLSVSVDGSSSTDPDGSIVSYSWNWGDGTALGSGVTASHSYAAAGAYTVTLTVVDNAGASHSVSKTITVQAPPADEFLIRDEFERQVTGGWGQADVGGQWSLSGGAASAASVASGEGRLTLAPGSTRILTLPSTAVRQSQSELVFSVGASPATGGSYVGIMPRQTSSANYLVQSWLRADGSVWLVAQRGSTVLATQPLAGLTYAAGDQFTLKVEATGVDSTQLRAKLWKAGAAEPPNWQLTAVDNAPDMQVDGTFGVRASRMSSATSSVTIAIDRLVVTLPQ
jgi:PKD repeat protein